MTLEFIDAFGNVADNADGSTVELILAAFPKGASLAGTATATASDGAATLDDLSLSAPGDYKLRAIDKSLGLSVTSAQIEA